MGDVTDALSIFFTVYLWCHGVTPPVEENYSKILQINTEILLNATIETLYRLQSFYSFSSHTDMTTHTRTK